MYTSTFEKKSVNEPNTVYNSLKYELKKKKVIKNELHDVVEYDIL